MYEKSSFHKQLEWHIHRYFQNQRVVREGTSWEEQEVVWSQGPTIDKDGKTEWFLVDQEILAEKIFNIWVAFYLIYNDKKGWNPSIGNWVSPWKRLKDQDDQNPYWEVSLLKVLKRGRQVM